LNSFPRIRRAHCTSVTDGRLRGRRDSTLLEWTGWKVDREFYYNDAGAQIANLA
jgi:hypothetical protein